MAQTPKKKLDPETIKKISEGYRYVKIPAVDIYDQPFDGFHFAAGHGKQDPVTGKFVDGRGKEIEAPFDGHFELHLTPGTHLLSAEVANMVEERLQVWQDSMIRMMRPSAHRASQQQATRRGMDIVANPEDME